MRRGFMGMMLKLRCNRHSRWGKGLLVQKKHAWVGQRSRWCWLCFLIGKAFPSWICTTWSDGKQMYQEFLVRLRDAVHRKRPELWKNQTWMLHHDNVPAHESLLIRNYLAKQAKVRSFFEQTLYIWCDALLQTVTAFYRLCRSYSVEWQKWSWLMNWCTEGVLLLHHDIQFLFLHSFCYFQQFSDMVQW